MVNCERERKAIGMGFSISIYSQHENMVQLLLDRHADVNQLSNIAKNSTLIEAFTGSSINIMKLLIRYGVDQKIKNIHKKTVLDYAKERGRQDIIDLLDK